MNTLPAKIEELTELWLIGALWKKRKGEACEFLIQTDVTNISPHRMYEMNLLENIFF
jgi:hypothetical protein